MLDDKLNVEVKTFMFCFSFLHKYMIHNNKAHSLPLNILIFLHEYLHKNCSITLEPTPIHIP